MPNPIARALLAATLLSAATAQAQPAAGPRFYSAPPTGAQRLPFSEAVQVGGVLYVTNQLGNVPGVGKVVEGGLDGQLRQTMANIAAILAANGLAPRDIFKCSVSLADMSQWPEMNRLWPSYFPADRLPVRNVVGVTSLPIGAVIGVECAAAAR